MAAPAVSALRRADGLHSVWKCVCCLNKNSHLLTCIHYRQRLYDCLLPRFPLPSNCCFPLRCVCLSVCACACASMPVCASAHTMCLDACAWTWLCICVSLHVRRSTQWMASRPGGRVPPVHWASSWTMVRARVCVLVCLCVCACVCVLVCVCECECVIE